MKEEDWDIKLLDYITGEVIDEKREAEDRVMDRRER